MIIRDFRREDLDDVIECTKKSFAEEFAITGFDPDVWRKIVRRRFSVFGTVLFGFFKLLDKEPIRFFVADVDGKVIGTTMVTARGNNGLIETVMVHPDFRRKGVATELMTAAINYAWKRGFTKAILQVSSNNHTAKSLYEKLGFRKFDAVIFLTVDLDSLSGLQEVEGIQVRDLQKSDMDQAYALIRNSKDLNTLQVYDFKKSDLKTSLWNRIFRMSISRKMVAFKGEEIVGYATISYTTAKQAARVSDLLVSRNTVSEGVEVELIRAGADYAKPSGSRTVLATVSLQNERLIRSLEAIGFEKRIIFEGMVLESVPLHTASRSV